MHKKQKKNFDFFLPIPYTWSHVTDLPTSKPKSRQNTSKTHLKSFLEHKKQKDAKKHVWKPTLRVYGLSRETDPNHEPKQIETTHHRPIPRRLRRNNATKYRTDNSHNTRQKNNKTTERKAFSPSKQKNYTMETGRGEALQPRTSRLNSPASSTLKPNVKPLCYWHQFCNKQWYMENTSSPNCPTNNSPASTAESFWQSPIPPFPPQLSTTAAKPLYTESLQHFSAKSEQLKQRQPFRNTKLPPPALKRNNSRKLAQRRRKRLIKKEINDTKKSHNIKQSLYNTITRCNTNYGFCADPNSSLQKNFNKAIKTQPSHLYTQPKNLTFHNLCKDTKLPITTRQLLGLHLKFCLSGNNMQQNINNTMLKMACSIRTFFYLKQHGIIQEGDYKKQIYVSLKNWHPPPAPLEIEEKMTTFEKLLKRKQEHLSTKNKKLN